MSWRQPVLVTYGKVVKWVIRANTLPKPITRWAIHVLPKFYGYGLVTDIGYIVASLLIWWHGRATVLEPEGPHRRPREERGEWRRWTCSLEQRPQQRWPQAWRDAHRGSDAGSAGAREGLTWVELFTERLDRQLPFVSI